MLPFNPMTHLDRNASIPKWWEEYTAHPYDGGQQCCSNYMVSFHYINRGLMYAIDYLIYGVKLFGSHHEHLEKYGMKNSPLFTNAKAFSRSYSGSGNRRNKTTQLL
ncbi:hypothetical protein QR680_010976 [Steinernema hermaphroditum]|uniref:Uncharacterized protein n=1 Tax=Steinernema hermaphroditum TaxID=289476 RepID=A0AA39MBJ3_9BILA|nr:hypothetical protein QR680_010976 [Steinernema hermaphroditum]